MQPAIGFGVYRVPPAETRAVVEKALEIGFRHIDTAQVYKNEKGVGEAVRSFYSSNPTESVHITTKVWRMASPCAPGFAYSAAKDSIAASLEALGQPIDLLLLHSPGASGHVREETWLAMEDAYLSGNMVKALGVSNFSERHLDQLLKAAKVRPAVNQLEVHPWLQRKELCTFCKNNGIHIEAYSPLAKASCLDDPTLLEICERRGITPAQALIAWSLAKGYTPLPKSVSPSRQAENFAAGRVSLNDEDMDALNALEDNFVTGWDPVSSDPV